MNIYSSLEELPKTPMAFTIGNFDGVHLGHQTLLKTLRSLNVPTCVLTFAEHPLNTLQPTKNPLVITPFPIKCLLLKTDFCLVLDFTKELASMSYNAFLDSLPISHLVLGKNSFFGKHREGTEENVRAWGKKKNVQVHYIEKMANISSTQIRTAIGQGDLTGAEKMLGRPHLLYAPSQRFSVSNLCLPPDGTYPLFGSSVTIKNQTISLATPVEKPTIFSFNPNEECSYVF